jgi:outer membrane lipoprotein-sorting protein
MRSTTLIAALAVASGLFAGSLSAAGPMLPTGWRSAAAASSTQQPRAPEAPAATVVREQPSAPRLVDVPTTSTPQPPNDEPAPAEVGPQQPTALQVLESAATRYRGTGAFCADFSQERTVTLLRETRRGRGRLCQQQPNLFMMRFSEPSGDRVIADGKDFCQYTPSTDPKQAICIPMSRAGNAYDFHREFLERPAEKYTLTLEGQEAVDGAQTHRVLLVPKQAAGYRQAKLWVDARSNLVKRLELQEENGTVQRITMSNIDLRATPPRDAFRVDLPAGVEVLRP